MKRLWMLCILLVLILFSGNVFAGDEYSLKYRFRADPIADKTPEVSAGESCELRCDQFYLSKSGSSRYAVIETGRIYNLPPCVIEEIALPDKNVINKEMNEQIQTLEYSFLKGEMNVKQFVAKRKAIWKQYGVNIDLH